MTQRNTSCDNMSDLDSKETMEGIQKKIRKIEDQTIVYFPIKHHSIACSHYLEKAIDFYKPEKILIELPFGAEVNLPILQSDLTIPPIALHSFYVDNLNIFELNGKLSPDESIPVRFEGYHPIVAYSPEYHAIQLAKEKEIEVEFIDLPLYNIIPYRFKQSSISLFYPDERYYEFNAYGALLAKKLRCRNFHEVWETMFETNLDMNFQEFMRKLYIFSLVARSSLSEEFLEQEGANIREEFMKYRIKKSYQDIQEKDRKGSLLVVTGAFHSVVLPFLKGKTQKIRKKENVIITVPYTYNQLALSSGYQSGNPAPRYYDKLWSNLRNPDIKDIKIATLNLALEVKNQSREYGSFVSVADSVHVFRMAQNLGSFRGKETTGYYDLVDAVKSVFIKGDEKIYGPSIYRALDEILIGDEYGTIDPNLSTTPLLADFQYRAKKLRIKLAAATKLMRLNLYQTSTAKLKSQFLHQTVFLNLGFGEMIKGPNLIKKENLHLLAEQWNIAYNRGVEIKLISSISLGNTVRNACLTLLREKFASTGESGVASELLLVAAQMGLVEVLDDLGKQLIDIIDKDRDFKSLVQALYQLVALYNYQESLLTEGFKPLLRLIEQAYIRATFLVPSILLIQEDEEETVIEKIKALTNFILSFDDIEVDKNLFIGQIKTTLTNGKGNHAVKGALTGVLYSLHEKKVDELTREINGYFVGGASLDGGSFVYGLFMICREILLLKEDFFDRIDNLVCQFSNEDFLTILPLFRRSFSLFTPKEIDIIGSNVAQKREIEKMEKIEISGNLAELLHFADQLAGSKFEEMGL